MSKKSLPYAIIAVAEVVVAAQRSEEFPSLFVKDPGGRIDRTEMETVTARVTEALTSMGWTPAEYAEAMHGSHYRCSPLLRFLDLTDTQVHDLLRSQS